MHQAAALTTCSYPIDVPQCCQDFPLPFAGR